jgi:tetratricopeptide (TPR) repeat protein
MTDRPLLGVRNRSPAERWHKWRSRQPAALRFILLLGLTVSTTLALTVGVWLYWAERIHEAELALAEGTRQMRDQQHYDDASVTLRHGLALVQNIPFGGDLAQQLGRQLEKAAAERDRASLNRLARKLHSQVEQMRVLFGMDITPSPQLNGIIATCRELWSKRTLIASSLGTNTVADLSELALLWADLRVRSATAAEFSGACHEAFKVLAEANEIFGASSAFVYEETRYLRALGLPTSPSTQSIPAKELWEHYALGRSYLRAGDPQRAAEELKNAQLRQPHDCWVNYYYGLCAYRLHQYEDAARAFSVCIGAAPDLAGVYYNRAMAFTALRRTELALRDLDRALELDPTLAAAVLNRGMLRLQEKRYANATSDLQQALKLGASPSTVHYDLALIDLAQNKRGEALVHVHHALQSSPAHQEARQLLEKLEKLDKK